MYPYCILPKSPSRTFVVCLLIFVLCYFSSWKSEVCARRLFISFWLDLIFFVITVDIELLPSLLSYWFVFCVASPTPVWPDTSVLYLSFCLLILFYSLIDWLGFFFESETCDCVCICNMHFEWDLGDRAWSIFRGRGRGWMWGEVRWDQGGDGISSLLLHFFLLEYWIIVIWLWDGGPCTRVMRRSRGREKKITFFFADCRV